MNRKVVMYDNWLYFLDDAGVLMECEGEVDENDFMHFAPEKASSAEESKNLPLHELAGIVEKLT